MLKFGNISKWSPLPCGEGVTFPQSVRVRLEVSTPHGADWYYSAEDGDVYFATTSGRECIEFVPEAGMVIMCASDALIYSAEFEAVHIPETGNPAFARIANRRERNPELERIAALAAANATARMEQMMREVELRHEFELERMRAAASAVAAADGAHVPPVADTGGTASGEVSPSAAAPQEVADGE